MSANMQIDDILQTMVIRSARLILRPMTVEDITPAYLAWLNDPVVTKGLEIRHQEQTYNTACAYIEAHLKDTANSRYWGIFEAQRMLHVGTVNLNDIHLLYKRADISFVIGHPETQGKGFATEAVHAVCNYAFSIMGLHRLTGGHYESNTGSMRVFQKNNFTLEGRRRQHIINVDGEREDSLIYGLLASEFQPQMTFCR